MKQIFNLLLIFSILPVLGGAEENIERNETVASREIERSSLTTESKEQPRESSKFARIPGDLTNQIEIIDTKKEGKIPQLFPFLDRWFAWKGTLKKRSGFEFAFAYTGLYQRATETLLGHKEAAGGIVELLGSWSLCPPKSPRPTLIGFRVEQRHRIGTEVPPAFFGAEIGSVSSVGPTYSEFPVALAELWFEHHFIKDRFGFRIGKVLALSMFDYFQFKGPRIGFINAVFSLNPAIAFPNFGLGGILGVRPVEDVYIYGGVHDANGTPTRTGFDTFFEDNEYFSILEVGYDPGYFQGDPYAPDYHITYWRVDSRKKFGISRGQGVTLSAQKTFCKKFVPFIRYGYSDGGTASLKHMCNIGAGYLDAFGWKNDILGFGLSWGDPSNPDLRNEYVSELFYRMQLAPNIQITPDIQLIVNPARHPNKDAIWVFSLRWRVTL